ncbi:MAG: hypothetical protein RR404_01645 [Bacilli bacterium]
MKNEKKDKIYNNIFKIIFTVLLIAFITLYFSNETGYFEYGQRRKVTLTEEKIKQFEDDVKNGKNIDLEEYLKETTKNYNNKTSKLGLFLSSKIGEYVRNGIETAFNTLNELIKEE